MDDAIRGNRDLWDAWARINAASDFYDVPSFRDGDRPIRLSDYEREEIGPVEGRTLLHLQCHFGMDTISWARLGAVATGVDFSEVAIATARQLAAEVGVPATFVVSTVYDLPALLEGAFDIVYTSRGVLGWLPDIGRWARVAAGYVKPGGLFYVTEIHPVEQVFADEGVAPGELRLGYPYWSHEAPITIEEHGSYADPDAPTDGLVSRSWDHSLGEIVTALVDAGLRIEFVHEFDFVEWPVPFLVRGEDRRYRLPPEAKGELPLFFSIRATKPLEADADAGPALPAGVADTLRALEHALARRDEAALPGGYEAVLDPAFSEIGSSGRTTGRDATIALLRSPDRTKGSIAIEAFQIAPLGPGAVIATYDALEDDRTPPRRTRRSSTWVRHGDRWRLRFHQGTVVAG